MNTLDQPSDQPLSDTLQTPPRRVSWLAPLHWLKQGWAIYRRDWRIWTLFGWIPAVCILLSGLPSFQLFNSLPTTAWDTFFQVWLRWFWIFFITGSMVSCIQGLNNGERLQFRRHFFSVEALSHDLGKFYSVCAVAVAWVVMSYGLYLALNTSIGKQLVSVMSLPIPINSLPAYLNKAFGNQTTFIIQFHYLLIAPLSLMFCFALLLAGSHKMSGQQILKVSVLGVIKNIIPLIAYTALCAGLLLLAGFAYFIPLLVIAPWLVCGLYSAYRHIYLINPS